ncbi:MAG: PEGA domain-containing protein [Deltaproteobacteria bacterium]|nr:MAG: PEGA domain-containing protein [Deltaproteobacteria bacterium]
MTPVVPHRTVARPAARRAPSRGAATVAAVAAAIAAMTADARAQGAAAGTAPLPVAIIDLRPGDPAALRETRAPLADAVAAVPGTSPIRDPALAAALAGDAVDAAARQAAAALDRARTAFGALDCAAAAAAADRAVLALAARQAAGDDVRAELIQAYSYALSCAGDDDARGHALAARLRGLGADPPPGVPAHVWARYPQVDATSNNFAVPVSIATAPAGATVYVDHVVAGASPVTVYLPEGEHVVAAAGPAGTAATALTVRGRAPMEVSLSLAGAPPPRALAVRDWVAAWRTGDREPTPRELHQLLDAVGARIAVLVTAAPATGVVRVEAWAAPPPPARPVAVLVGGGTIDQIRDVVAVARAQVLAWDRGGPTVAAAAQPRPATDRRAAKAWWMYAAIGGAVAVAAAVIVGSQLSGDTQVVRIVYP